MPEPGMEIEARPAGDVNLFGATGADMIVAAKAMADPLADLIKEQKLFTLVHGKAHVHLEGWQTLGAMLPNAVTAVIVGEPIPIYKDTDQEQHKLWGYRAYAEARLLDGRVVGAAWSECTRDEDARKPWPKAPPHALLGMAQTRAMARALKGPLGWVMKLAGYEPTPAEEMDAAQVVVDGAPAEITWGDGPEAEHLQALYRAANASDPIAWSPAKVRARLASIQTEEELAALAVELTEWLDENGVDGSF